MSPRAACRLETLGFVEVYDYVAGKVDWLAHGLPTEGDKADALTAGALARKDVVTAQLEERIGDIRERVARSGYSFALVLSDDGILLGRLPAAALQDTSEALAKDAMEPGPSTIRPHTAARDVLGRLREHPPQTSILTTPEGKLLGIVRREDAEAQASTR